MSSRKQHYNNNTVAARLRDELETLKKQTAEVEAAVSVPSPTEANADLGNTAFDSLSGVEQAAGSLGVHPEAWKPIKFMNNAHFANLIQTNALDGDLARRIEAYRAVAATAQ